jgi:hypothetical protein
VGRGDPPTSGDSNERSEISQDLALSDDAELHLRPPAATSDHRQMKASSPFFTSSNRHDAGASTVRALTGDKRHELNSGREEAVLTQGGQGCSRRAFAHISGLP